MKHLRAYLKGSVVYVSFQWKMLVYPTLLQAFTTTLGFIKSVKRWEYFETKTLMSSYRALLLIV